MPDSPNGYGTILTKWNNLGSIPRSGTSNVGQRCETNYKDAYTLVVTTADGTQTCQLVILV